jgi:hypothetical protein
MPVGVNMMMQCGPGWLAISPLGLTCALIVADDMVASWIAAQTVIVYCSLFYLSYTYSGPFKWPMTAIFTILCGELLVRQRNACFREVLSRIHRRILTLKKTFVAYMSCMACNNRHQKRIQQKAFSSAYTFKHAIPDYIFLVCRSDTHTRVCCDARHGTSLILHLKGGKCRVRNNPWRARIHTIQVSFLYCKCKPLCHSALYLSY